TWACYLIARHPKVQAILHSEVDEVLQGAMPVLADLPKLKYATMVLKEAMRLYPPIWIIERTSVNDDEIVGYHIPARTMVVVSPYALHRTAKYWEEPEQFVPERFADETAIARFSYLPFGGGPHLCIGNNFAMMESQFALAMIAQRFRLHLVSDAVVKAKPVRRN
ncbi:MAG TPA: cytochrome P450, partial [Blastocatellia bacterium]|nr:cytochrome P450 [Blastocatellia bacterium]